MIKIYTFALQLLPFVTLFCVSKTLKYEYSLHVKSKIMSVFISEQSALIKSGKKIHLFQSKCSAV